MSYFFIRFHLPKIEDAAAGLGFYGTRWKSKILEDLLFDGELRVSKAPDLTDPVKKKTIWYCQGRNVSLACSLDAFADDTLFCIGLVPGPARGGPAERHDLVHVPGPWGVATMGHRGSGVFSLGEHLNRMWEMHDPSRSERQRGQNDGKGQSIGAGLSHSPFEVLKGMPVSKTPVPTTIPRPPDAPPTASDTRPPDQCGSRDNTRAGDPAPVERPEKVAVLPSPDTAPAPPSSTAVSPNPEERDRAPTQRPLAEEAADLTPVPAAEAAKGPHSFEDVSSWGALATQGMTAAYPSFRGILGTDDPVQARWRLVERLEAEIAALQKRLESIPSADDVRQAEHRRHEVQAAGLHLGVDPPKVVQVSALSELERGLDSLGSGILDTLPEWALASWGTGPDVRVAAILGSADQLVHWLALVDWLEDTFVGSPPSALRGLPDPGGEGTPTERLERAWSAEADLAGWREHLPNAALPVLRALRGGERQKVGNRLAVWSSLIHTDAFAELVEKLLAEPGKALTRCPSLRDRDRLEERDLRILKVLPDWEKVQHLLDRLLSRQPVVEDEDTEEEGRVAFVVTRVDHVITDEAGSVIPAPLVIPEPAVGASAVLVEVPVRVVANCAPDGPVELTVSSAAFSGVPLETRLPNGAELFTAGRRTGVRWTLGPADTSWESMPNG